MKSATKAHHELLVAVGQEMIREQALEYFGMEDDSSKPTQNVHGYGTGKECPHNKYECMEALVLKFMDFFGYGNFNLEEFVVKPTNEAIDVRRLPNGNLEFIVDPATHPDRLLNYCTNLCHWALHVMELDDTACEGDLTRIVPNCMYSLPFFYSHSELSEYFVECIDYILKVEHTLPPLQRMLVLEGTFVNMQGGAGNNVESDYKQEQSVRNQKDLVRRLGSNKSEKAISRALRAADTLACIIERLDYSLHITAGSGRHTKSNDDKDRDIIRKCLRDERPFRFTPGRGCPGFDHITSSPFEKINRVDMQDRMADIISRIFCGVTPDLGNEAVGSDDDDE